MAVINSLLESESEDDNVSEHTMSPIIESSKPKKSKKSRLSQLSKLNLLGLIDLALIASELKLNKRVEDAIKLCDSSVATLKELNGDALDDVGIAS